MNGEENSSIKIFVTHKSEDIKIVKKFIQIFQLYDGAQRLEFLIAEEMLTAQDWREWIHRSVTEADLLFFLIISPTEEWEWCIYEAGLFIGRNSQSSNNRIIIFFDPSQHNLPQPLEHLQGVRANQDDVVRFLKQFYGKTILTGIEPPLNSKFTQSPSAIHNAAREICSLLSGNI